MADDSNLLTAAYMSGMHDYKVQCRVLTQRVVDLEWLVEVQELMAHAVRSEMHLHRHYTNRTGRGYRELEAILSAAHSKVHGQKQ